MIQYIKHIQIEKFFNDSTKSFTDTVEYEVCHYILSGPTKCWYNVNRNS